VTLSAFTVAAAPVDPASGRWGRLVPPLLLAATGAAATAYVYAVDPNQPGHYPLCPSYALAGIWCPGCGMLRATHDLAHGDVGGALARNPGAPLVLLGILAVFGAWAFSRWTGRRITWTPGRWAPWVVGVLVVGFTIARNVPGWTWASPA
jgi:hypothetical protein